MKTGWIGTSIVAGFLLVQATGARADEAADRCGSAKLKAMGKWGQSWLKCHADATKKQEPLGDDCTLKANGKLISAFDKAEDAGGCATTDDEGDASTALIDDIDAVVTALAPADTDEARACASSKMKAAGKQIGAILKCYASGAKNSEGPETDCLARASEKIQKLFSNAEAKGGCTTTGDVGAIANEDTEGSEDVVEVVSPVCGDAIVGPGQECEIASDAACPGLCEATCTCVFPPDCGDGVAELPEECDDGGNADGDGCSALCVLENSSALCAGVATTPGTAIDAVLLASGFNAPIHAAAAPLDPARLFVVEREGLIRILDLADNSIEATPFLDISDLTTTDGERGLLSMAFDPDYASTRRFFVYYTDNSGNIVIARYQTDAGDPNVADESTAHVLLTIPHPGQSNHNGGQVAFGADGYLYAATGDGGGGGDPDENGQDDNAMLGKMLRIDIDVDVPPYYAVPASNPGYVDGTSDLELVWAKGLRNPWRFSFDRDTGDLLIGDVGQGSREEIDFAPASSTGGENYGWDIFEGTVCHEPEPPAMSCPADPVAAGFTMPILEYDHATAGCETIAGGFVYRGCAMPDYIDTYFYSDTCQNFLRTIQVTGGAASNPQNRTGDATSAGATFDGIASFAEDARGEIYMIDIGDGELYRLEPQ